MIAPVRFLFDECIGKPSMLALHDMVPTEAEFSHITDIIHSGAKDPEWIPRIATAGGWIVITSDGGKQSRRGDKLPQLCRDYKVTHVVLSATLHEKKSHEKVAALALVWSQVELLGGEEPGSRFNLRYRSLKGPGNATVIVLVEADKPTNP